VPGDNGSARGTNVTFLDADAVPVIDGKWAHLGHAGGRARACQADVHRCCSEAGFQG
jgi:hypothetical protein